MVIVTDPFESSVGLTAPRFKSDLVLQTKINPAYISEKSSETRNVSGPGEYEVQGVQIAGLRPRIKSSATVRFIASRWKKCL